MFYLDAHWQFQQLFNNFFHLAQMFLIALVLLVAYLGYKKPALAVAIIAATLPFYLFRSDLLPIPVTSLELNILAAVLGWLSSLVVQKKRPIFPPPLFLVLSCGFLLSATVAVLLSNQLLAAAGLWKAYVLEPMLFAWMTYNVVKTKEDKKSIISGFVCLLTWLSVSAIYQYFSGFGITEPSWFSQAGRRVSGSFTSPNALGLLMAPLLILLLPLIVQYFKQKKLALVTVLTSVVLLTLLALFATKSQGTILGILAGGLFLSFYFFKLRNIIVAMILLTATLFAVPQSREQFFTYLAFQDAGGQNRLALMDLSRQILTENPAAFIGGAGILGFSEIQNAVRNPLVLEPLLYPHMIILNFWLEFGLLGVTTISFLVVLFFFTARKKIIGNKDEKYFYLGLTAAMMAIIFHGLVDVPYFKNDLAVLFWTILILGIAPINNSIRS